MADPRESDTAFMEIVVKRFQDKNKKSNCWKAVAERVGEPIDIVKRRHESIRTQFSKYLRSRKGSSGCDSDDVPICVRFEHLPWLKTFINSRASSTNLKQKIGMCNKGKKTIIAINMVTLSFLLPPPSNDIDDQDLEFYKDATPERGEYEDEASFNQGPSTDVETLISDNESVAESQGSVGQAQTSSAQSESVRRKDWVKKESRKRQLEKVDVWCYAMF
eukprot:gene2222-2530_t